jgi:hypothetical protein
MNTVVMMKLRLFQQVGEGRFLLQQWLEGRLEEDRRVIYKRGVL